MERVERPDRLDWKWPPRALHNGGTEAQDGPVAHGPCKSAVQIDRDGSAELAKSSRAMDDAIAFDESEIRADDLVCRRKGSRDIGAARFAEQPRQHCTRFGIENHARLQRSPRS